MSHQQPPYRLIGNKFSDQAEASTENMLAASVQMRILVELQVISMLLHQQSSFNTDLAEMRQSIADSIT